MKTLNALKDLVREVASLAKIVEKLGPKVPQAIADAANVSLWVTSVEVWHLRKRILPMIGLIVGITITAFTLLPLINGWGWIPLPLWMVMTVHVLTSVVILAAGVVLYWTLGALEETANAILATVTGAIPEERLKDLKESAKRILGLLSTLRKTLTRVSTYLAVLPSWAIVPLLLVSTNNDHTRREEKGKFAYYLLGFAGVSCTVVAAFSWWYLVWSPYVLTAEYGNARLAEVVTPTHLYVNNDEGLLRGPLMGVGQKLCMAESFQDLDFPGEGVQGAYATYIPPDGTVDCVLTHDLERGGTQKRSVQPYWHRNPWTISGWIEIVQGAWARNTAPASQDAEVNQTPPAVIVTTIATPSPQPMEMANFRVVNNRKEEIRLFVGEDYGVERLHAPIPGGFIHTEDDEPRSLVFTIKNKNGQVLRRVKNPQPGLVININ